MKALDTNDPQQVINGKYVAKNTQSEDDDQSQNNNQALKVDLVKSQKQL